VIESSRGMWRVSYGWVQVAADWAFQETWKLRARDDGSEKLVDR
jgi:hypothetical protein